MNSKEMVAYKGSKVVYCRESGRESHNTTRKIHILNYIRKVGSRGIVAFHEPGTHPIFGQMTGSLAYMIEVNI